MTNLTNRPPPGLKDNTNHDDHAHLNRIRALHCIACGKPGPSEAHHCRDKPYHAERDIYKSIPGAAMRSADRDAIPLCPHCHWIFHNRRSEFHALYGKDYRMIPVARALVKRAEIDF